MASDERSLAIPQSGMIRDLNPVSLTETQYTFAMNANIESEDGNMNMRSNEHSTLKCLDFGDYKVVGYKNDLTTGDTYFFITNPKDNTSKITYVRNPDSVSALTDDQIKAAVEGTLEIGSEPNVLIEDDASDPCLNFSIYHPIKTIEIKAEKCGKCLYWTDDLNPPRYVIIEKALEPDDDGDIWYHYHGYKICGGQTRDEFIKENGCKIACEKLRVFPLLQSPCIEPVSIEYGGSLRAGVYQFAVALCDKFGNEKTDYTSLTNPVAVFDGQYRKIENGRWGERTNLGIRLQVSNIDKQVDYYKIVVIQNTVGYNGETQPAIDYFIEGVHPITERTVYYYTDTNNQRTTFQHIANKRAIYNTSRGIASVDNRLIQYGLTAEKEWNLQPVVSLMGHFLKWQASVAHEDLYKDGSACSLYVGYMRNEVYPFSISFKTSTGYRTPAFLLVPPPFKDARKEVDKENDVGYQSVSQYAPDCSGNERKYEWQYTNTAGPAIPIDDAVVVEEAEECKNIATIGQTLIVESNFATYNGSIRFIIDGDDLVGESINYLSENIGTIACDNRSNGSIEAAICDTFRSYREDGTQEQMYPIDKIEVPEMPGDCEVPHRDQSVLTAPQDLMLGFKEEYIYKNKSEMEHVTTDYLYTTGGENQNKYSILFNYDTLESLTEWMEEAFFGENAGGLSGDNDQHVCSEYYPYLQPASILKAVSDTLYIFDTMPCTCGCYKESVCKDPSVSRSDYNNFQNNNYLMGGYILKKDAWNQIENFRAGRSTSAVINEIYRSLKGPKEVINQYWSSVDKTKFLYMDAHTGIKSSDWTYAGYVNQGTFPSLIPENMKGSIGFASEFVAYRFEEQVLTNARFIQITRPSEWDDPFYKTENKNLILEAMGKLDGLMDGVSTNFIRLSFWKDVETWEPLSEMPVDFGDNYISKSNHSIIVNVSRPAWGEINEAFFNRIGATSFYVTVEPAIVAAPWIMTFRQLQFCKYKDGDVNSEEEEAKKPSRGILGASFITGKTIYPYIFGIREKEVQKIDISLSSITLRSTVVFASKCQSCGDKPLNCKPRPFRYGDFAYYESSEKYPANSELYDSRRMKIKQSRSYTGSQAKKFDDIKTKLAEYYGNPVSEQGGLVHYEGHTYGTETTSTLLCQKPIRHYKFPDNSVIPFMSSDERGYDVASEVYPIGIMIDEEVVQIFLDFAVDSGLITQEQRSTIVGYELFRGDRRLNRSVVASGIAFDMLKYIGDDGNMNIYSNYPYNDLSEDNFNYATGARSRYISHPFDKLGNVWYTFHSPDMSFNKPELPTEVYIDGFQRGMSVGNFTQVEDHPKWTILGPQSYKQASILASTESIATVASLIAEELMNRSTSAYIGVIGNINMAMIFSSMILTITQTLAKRPVLYGKYRYDWLNTFVNNGPRKNHAWYYASVGYYNSMINYLDKDQYKRNRLRGLSTVKQLKSGIYPIMDSSMTSSWVTGKQDGEGGDFIFINNIDREGSVFLSFGNPGTKSGIETTKRFLLEYPSFVYNYDNSRVDDPAVEGNDAIAKTTFERTKIASYVCSPYMKLVRYRPDQYGGVEDIRWVSIGGCGLFTGEKKLIFGGDTVISRFSLKRKFPVFMNNAFGIGDMIPFPYDDYRNVGYPKYFVNYDTGEDELSITDNERFNSWTSSNKGRYSFFPNRISMYNLNRYTGGKYVDGRFYLWFYGIPQFLVESEINCNFRLMGSTPEEFYYPEIGDYVWWTQEKNVSIRRDNDYKISPIYTSRNSLVPSILPSTYDRKFYDCAYQRPNGVIWSVSDVSENSQTDPWLTYRPMDYHEFPTRNGKLIHMKRIESNQLLVRFEDQVSLYNAIDVIKERVAGQTEMGTGGLFSSRPLEYNTTDLGYSGTQSTEIVSSEFGHFWVDVKRGQVFMTDPNGQNLKELSVGIRHWLKMHLPFKILKAGIVNVDTEQEMTYEDVDNKFIGLGLSLGWDNRYKRVFITKKDYIPTGSVQNYKFKGGKFYVNDTEVSLNSSYFKDVSFTLSYSCVKGEWISYYSFCPDYYIEQQSYFQSGNNYSLGVGLWSHLLTNKSFLTFYGYKHPFIIETPVKEKFTGTILSSLEYEMEARRYEDDVNYINLPKIGLDSIIVYNDTNNSGEIDLVPADKNNQYQQVSYPKTEGGKTMVLDTEVYGRHKVNDFFNRIREEGSTTMWVKDENDIMKEVNPSALSFSQNWLDRIRGSWLLTRMKKYATDMKIIFKWVITEDKLKNR